MLLAVQRAVSGRAHASLRVDAVTFEDASVQCRNRPGGVQGHSEAGYAENPVAAGALTTDACGYRKNVFFVFGLQAGDQCAYYEAVSRSRF